MSKQSVPQSPLCWPAGWPRTKSPRHSPFGRWNTPHTIARASGEVLTQLDRMGVADSDVVISSDLRYRQDGIPYSNQREPDDQGVAVYFPLNGEQRVLACDRWNRIGDNLWAIAKHLEALRGQERWGVGSLDQAFRGYQALPQYASGDAPIHLGPGPAHPWWEVLGVAPTANAGEVRLAYLDLARKLHPDRGGDLARMSAVTRAKREADRALGVAS